MADIKPAKCVRFGGHLATVIEEHQNGIEDNYNVIISQLQDRFLKSSHLHALLQQFIQVVHFLDKNHKKLVSQLIGIRWVIREKEIIQVFLDFLIALVSGNSVHQVQVMNCLIKHFMPADCLVKDAVTYVPQQEIFEMLHVALRKIFQLIPLTPALVFPLLASNYPFMKKELTAMEFYIKNLVYITTYQSSLRAPILELIVSKTLKLDTLCPSDVIKRALQEEENIFEMETEQASDKKETFVNKLDVVMDILLRYVRGVSFAGEELTPQAHMVFQEMLSIFDKVILPIHDSSQVQFIMFYVCSFKTSYFEEFRDHLWKKVQDPNTPAITRQTVLSYLASILSRGKFIPLQVVIDTLNTMVSWILCYINEREGECSYVGSVHEMLRHGTFYSACQAVFYVLIFKHKQILDLSDGFRIMRRFKLEHIVTSRLNPLKFCLSTVVNHFASTMRQRQIVYCNTIIERNARQTLPVHGQSEKAGSVNPLDSFFPFDPYLLPSSVHIFDDLYQEWEGAARSTEDMQNEDEIDIDMLGNPMDIQSVVDQEKQLYADSFGEKSAGFSPGFPLISPSF